MDLLRRKYSRVCGLKNKQSYSTYSIYFSIIYDSKILETTLLSIDGIRYNKSSINKLCIMQWSIIQLHKGIIKGLYINIGEF